MLTAAQKSKVRWHCRRGMLELDTLLMPFYEHQFELLSESQQHLFIQLLECSDLDLFHWLLKQKSCLAPHQEIVTLILQYNKDYGFNSTRA